MFLLFECVSYTMKVIIRTFSDKSCIAVSIVGASACVKLKRYEEATSWCDKGLAVSFDVTSVPIP